MLKLSSGPSRLVRVAAPALAAASVLAGVAGLVEATAAKAGGSANGLPTLAGRPVGILGTPGNDRIALRLEQGNPGVLQVDFGDDGSAERSIPLVGVSKIVVNALGGDDAVRIDESNGVFTDRIATTLRGGPGDDTLIGGSGAETLDGGSGNDRIVGKRGNDVAFMGAGDDRFFWDPGDGSDTIEGQAGNDTMLFDGAAAAEQVDLSANGHRLRFFRDVANITMDTNGVENVDFKALGGKDVVTVNNLAGTDVKNVNVDLAGTLGGSTGDGAADQVIIKGTAGDDAVNVSGDADEITASGLAATVRIQHAEVADDRLDLNTAPGADTVNHAGLDAGAIQLFENGVLVP